MCPREMQMDFCNGEIWARGVDFSPVHTSKKWNICTVCTHSKCIGVSERVTSDLCVLGSQSWAKQSDVGCCREALKGPSVSQPAMGRFPLLANARLALEKLSVITPSQR